MIWEKYKYIFCYLFISSLAGRLIRCFCLPFRVRRYCYSRRPRAINPTHFIDCCTLPAQRHTLLIAVRVPAQRPARLSFFNRKMRAPDSIFVKEGCIAPLNTYISDIEAKFHRIFFSFSAFILSFLCRCFHYFLHFSSALFIRSPPRWWIFIGKVIRPEIKLQPT